MDKKILIGGILAILIIVVVVVVIIKKKENYTANPVANDVNYLTADSNGNIKATSNVEISGGVTVNGSQGNPGDVVVSMGNGFSPMLMPGFQRLIGYYPLAIVGGTEYGVNVPIFSGTLNNLIPGKMLMITAFFPLVGDAVGVAWENNTGIRGSAAWIYQINAYINGSSKESQGLAFPLANQTTGDWNGEIWTLGNYNCLPTMTFSFPSDIDGSSTQNLVISSPTGQMRAWSVNNAAGSTLSAWVTVYEV